MKYARPPKAIGACARAFRRSVARGDDPPAAHIAQSFFGAQAGKYRTPPMRAGDWPTATKPGTGESSRRVRRWARGPAVDASAAERIRKIVATAGRILGRHACMRSLRRVYAGRAR